MSDKTLQNKIGADIIMALDDVVKTTITGPRMEQAMYRTLRWIDRCISGMNIYHCMFFIEDKFESPAVNSWF